MRLPRHDKRMFMEAKQKKNRGFGSELRVIARRARQVWRLVPRRHKLALGGASLVMAIGSGASTAIPLLIAGLVDRVKTGLDHRSPNDAIYQSCGILLAFIAVVYLLRETLNVLRRYLVEATCTRVDRDMT